MGQSCATLPEASTRVPVPLPSTDEEFAQFGTANLLKCLDFLVAVAHSSDRGGGGEPSGGVGTPSRSAVVDSRRSQELRLASPYAVLTRHPSSTGTRQHAASARDSSAMIHELLVLNPAAEVVALRRTLEHNSKVRALAGCR